MSATLLQLPQRPAKKVESQLCDLRFRSLLPADEWERLPAEVRARFSKRLAGAETALYRGFVVGMHMSALGCLLAQVCRLFGAPLPLSRSSGCAAVVSVSEEPGRNGQHWTRIYGRKNGFPQVIHSAKRFAGTTGLEEYLGHGLGMALRIEALGDGLAFVSDHYFMKIRDRRLRIPNWLTPGTARITHRQVAGKCFLFELSVDHPWVGNLLHQQVLFDDVE